MWSSPRCTQQWLVIYVLKREKGVKKSSASIHIQMRFTKTVGRRWARLQTPRWTEWFEWYELMVKCLKCRELTGSWRLDCDAQFLGGLGIITVKYWGGHMNGGGIIVTFLSPPEPKITSMHCIFIHKINRSYMACGRPFAMFTPTSMAFSFPVHRTFSKRAGLSLKFSRGFPMKILCQHILSPDYYMLWDILVSILNWLYQFNFSIFMFRQVQFLYSFSIIIELAALIYRQPVPVDPADSSIWARKFCAHPWPGRSVRFIL